MLSEAQRDHLTSSGFVLLGPILDGARIAQAQSLISEWLAMEREELPVHGGSTLHLQRNLLGAAPVFDAILTPQLLAAVEHVVGPKAAAGRMHYRAPLPGYGAQMLHNDFGAPVTSEPFQVATAILALVDFTKNNGPTRLIPGSHRLPKIQTLVTPDAEYSGQTLVECPAGHAVVFNGHLWHSGTRNKASAPRHSLQITFSRAP